MEFIHCMVVCGIDPVLTNNAVVLTRFITCLAHTWNHSFYFLIPGRFFTFFLHQMKWFSLQFENKLSKFINDTSAATPACCTSSIFFISQDHVIWLYTIFLMEISYSGRCKHLCIFSSKILLSPLKSKICLLRPTLNRSLMVKW